MYRITYFTALNHIRKHTIKTKTIEDWDHPQSDSSALAIVHSEDREKVIDLALKRLKPQERAIITLFYLEEQSIEEIAAITKLSISNTKVKIHRTRKKLKSILSEQLKGEELDLLYN